MRAVLQCWPMVVEGRAAAGRQRSAVACAEREHGPRQLQLGRRQREDPSEGPRAV
eukprot:jgi/Chlat1/7414/Chrsp6S07490